MKRYLETIYQNVSDTQDIRLIVLLITTVLRKLATCNEIEREMEPLGCNYTHIFHINYLKVYSYSYC